MSSNAMSETWMCFLLHNLGWMKLWICNSLEYKDKNTHETHKLYCRPTTIWKKRDELLKQSVCNTNSIIHLSHVRLCNFFVAQIRNVIIQYRKYQLWQFKREWKNISVGEKMCFGYTVWITEHETQSWFSWEKNGYRKAGNDRQN